MLCRGGGQIQHCQDWCKEERTLKGIFKLTIISAIRRWLCVINQEALVLGFSTLQHRQDVNLGLYWLVSDLYTFTTLALRPQDSTSHLRATRVQKHLGTQEQPFSLTSSRAERLTTMKYCILKTRGKPWAQLRSAWLMSEGRNPADHHFLRQKRLHLLTCLVSTICVHCLSWPWNDSRLNPGPPPYRPDCQPCLWSQKSRT